MTPSGPKNIFDVIIIGGGVVGCGIMRKLTLQGYNALLLERGGDILSGASKANSAILHTGFDAPEASLEHACMQDGYKEFLSIREKLGLPLIKTAAHVVAWTREELDKLPGIVAKAHKNKVLDVKQISREELLLHEPNLSDKALGAVHVPGEFVIDPWSSPLAYLSQAVAHGAKYRFHSQVTGGFFSNGLWTLQTPSGMYKTKLVINSAGLYGDIVERICAKPPFTIHPRKGQFVVLDKKANQLVNSIILPVPSSITKGVLVCRTIFGNLIVGPTAEEQDDRDRAMVDNDVLNDLLAKGKKLVPALDRYEITATYAGLRTATEHKGYQIFPTPGKNWIGVNGIRSTGLTSSLGIANYVHTLVEDHFKTNLFANVTPVAKEDIIWPVMPNLYEDAPRDYQKPGSGEIFCHCEMVTKREVEAVFSSLVVPQDIGGIRRRTRAMMGRCNGFNCMQRMQHITKGRIANGFHNDKEKE